MLPEINSNSFHKDESMSQNPQQAPVAFISVSYKNRQNVDNAIKKIISVLDDFGIKVNVFVDNYTFQQNEEDEMMKASCRDIAQSDFVIAEASHKAVGLGVEVGYAVGLGKPVIYLRQENSEHSTTVAGISTYKIIYKTADDMDKQLREILQEIAG
ncbi:MAG: hypothetical protein Phog2KO_21000 [Phototrophicaceae bacterium]